MKNVSINSNPIESGGLISDIRLNLAINLNAAESQKLVSLRDETEIKKSLCKVRLCNSQKSKAHRGTL